MKFVQDIPGGKVMLALILCFFISCGVHSPKHAKTPLVENVLPVVSVEVAKVDTVKKDTTVILHSKTVISPRSPSLQPLSKQIDNNTQTLNKLLEVTTGQTQIIQAVNVSNEIIRRLNAKVDSLNQLAKSEHEARINERKQYELKDNTNQAAAKVVNYTPLFFGVICLIISIVFFFLGRRSKDIHYTHAK